MSRNNPIPVKLRERFKAHMDAHNNDDLPDGAWFAVLEDAAEEFFIKFRLQRGDPNSAAHQYLRMLPDATEVQGTDGGER